MAMSDHMPTGLKLTTHQDHVLNDADWLTGVDENDDTVMAGSEVSINDVEDQYD